MKTYKALVSLGDGYFSNRGEVILMPRGSKSCLYASTPEFYVVVSKNANNGRWNYSINYSCSHKLYGTRFNGQVAASSNSKGKSYKTLRTLVPALTKTLERVFYTRYTVSVGQYTRIDTCGATDEEMVMGCMYYDPDTDAVRWVFSGDIVIQWQPKDGDVEEQLDNYEVVTLGMDDRYLPRELLFEVARNNGALSNHYSLDELKRRVAYLLSEAYIRQGAQHIDVPMHEYVGSQNLTLCRPLTMKMELPDE